MVELDVQMVGQRERERCAGGTRIIYIYMYRWWDRDRCTDGRIERDAQLVG